VVAGLELGVTEAGLNEQVASAGSPLQAKLTGLVNEPCGVTVSVNVAVCPAVIVCDAGFALSMKSAALTVSVTAADVLPALLVSPL
jgi:hypothetical protein